MIKSDKVKYQELKNIKRMNESCQEIIKLTPRPKPIKQATVKTHTNIDKINKIVKQLKL